MNKGSKYWSRVLKNLSKHNVGDLLTINFWWPLYGGGASYTTVCTYLRTLAQAGYLSKYSRGVYKVIKKIPETLKY